MIHKCYKKAQQSRNDLFALYGICFLIVMISVGSLYGLGIIGNGHTNGDLLGSNKITAAAIAVPVDNSNLLEQETNNSLEVVDE